MSSNNTAQPPGSGPPGDSPQPYCCYRVNIQGAERDVCNWRCACPRPVCPGNRVVTRWFGQNWYGVCESVSSLAPEDYTDLHDRFAPGTVDHLRAPYYPQQYMHGGLGSPASPGAAAAGPSGHQYHQQQGGYQQNEAMGYYPGGGADAWPDDPIPGPGMDGGGGGGSGSGSGSVRGSARSGKSSSSSSSRQRREDPKGKGRKR